MDWKNAKRLLDGYIEDTDGIAFSAYTDLTRGATRHGGGADWKDGKRIRTRVPARDKVKVARNTYLERGSQFRPPMARPAEIGSKYRQGYSFVNDTFATVYGAAGTEDAYPDSAIGLRFHETYIAVFTPHWTELFTDGWSTMATRKRMESFLPVAILASRGGWAVCTVKENLLPCYCERDAASVRASGNGIVIRGEHSRGLALHFTGEYDPAVESSNPNGAPIYDWQTCRNCNGEGTRAGFDFESGGHPYFDGIRVSPDGTRLMREQPNRARTFEPVYTTSGFTGETLGRRRPAYYGGY